MLPVYVELCNVTTLQRTMGLIGIIMACYGRKSKFADESFSGEHIDDHTQAADPFMLSSVVLLGSIGPTGTS